MNRHLPTALAILAFVISVGAPSSVFAYTYNNPPTSSGATTVANTKCTGTFVKSLGSYADTVQYSWNTYAWSFLDSTQLPANYNNAGIYCIQAQLTSVTTGGGGGGGGGGGNLNVVPEALSGNLLSLLLPKKASAQVTTYTITYGLYNGTGTAAGTDYYTLTYAAVPVTPTATLSASPTSISSGNSSALTWSSTNATSCTGTGFSTGNATSGTVSVSPTTTTTYSVTCTGTGGTSPAATATVTVTAPVVTAVLTVSPASIATGGSSTLSWSSTNAARCTGAGGDNANSVFSTGNATSGSIQVQPSGTITYTLTCYSADYSAGTGGTGTCSPQNATYNPTCNADAEPKDISCPDGYRVQFGNGRYCGTIGNFTGYHGFAQTAQCVACASGGGTAGTGSSATDSKTVTVNAAQCSDGIDNDGDGLIDLADPDCLNNPNNPTESASNAASCSVSNTHPLPGQTITYTVSGGGVSGGGGSGGGGSSNGTWQYRSSDTTDLACPWTDPNRPYSAMPTCAQDPIEGSPCSNPPDNNCKINSGICSAVHTDIYSCVVNAGSYTWTPSNPSMCTSSTGTTLSCTYTVAGPYTVSVTPSGGSAVSCPAVTAGGNTPTATITANPLRVTSGKTSVITWGSTNTTSCTVSGPGLSSTLLSDSRSVTVTGQQRYDISCNGGAATDFVIVNVSPVFKEF